MARRKPKRRIDKTGRSEPQTSFVMIHSWLTKSLAWKETGPFERAVLLELYGLYNGRNNGDLFLSCREAARRCNMSKDRANKALEKLRELGFTRYRAEDLGHFNERNAQCWILTEFAFQGREPTKDFMSWRPSEKRNPRPEKRTARPGNGTAMQPDASHSEELSGKRDGEGRFRRNDCPGTGTQLHNHTELPESDASGSNESYCNGSAIH